eukprot:c37778_g1_i1 orf=2-172(-)
MPNMSTNQKFYPIRNSISESSQSIPSIKSCRNMAFYSIDKKKKKKIFFFSPKKKKKK